MRTSPAIEVVLVLDAGTSGGRACLVTREGQIRSLASRRWSLSLAADGAQDLPTEQMAQLLDEAIGEVLRASSDATVVAISTTSIRGALVLLDADGTVLWACGSSDTRAASEIRAALPDEPELHRRTGQKVVYAAQPRLRWLEQHRPDVVARTACVMPLDGWLARRLVVSDVPASIASASAAGLVDVATRAWFRDGKGGADLGAWDRCLPPLAEAGSVAGTLDAAVARRMDLPASTRVAVGGGDAQLAGLGLSRIVSGDTAVIMGSHWQQTVTLDQARTDPGHRFRVIAHAAAGTWQADAIAWGAGLFLDWFVSGWAGPVGRPPAEPDRVLVELEREASTLPPGAGGVLAVAGLPSTDPDGQHAAPTLLGFQLSESRTSRPAAFRAIIEAGCFAADANLRAIEQVTGTSERPGPIRVGGGASRSDLACSILANVTGRVIERSTQSESSLLGGAICAGVAAGWFTDTPTGAREFASVDRTFLPDESARAAYRSVAERWRAVAASQRDLARAGITNPVWQPPA